MNILQAEQVVKAVVDGVEEYTQIAIRAGVDPSELVKQDETVDRAIQLIRGFNKYGREDMQPAGLPPPPNPYHDAAQTIDEQSAEYYAFEALQRRGMTHERAVWTCGQFGVNATDAERAIDNVAMPWRTENGWRSYAALTPRGAYVLYDRPPVKIHRHLERFLKQLAE